MNLVGDYLQRAGGFAAALVASAVLSGAAQAQQDVAMNPGGYPVAPTGLADNPLPEGPFTYRTAEGMDIRVEVVARGIEYPMALTFLPDRSMLVVTRKGELLQLAPGTNKPRVVSGGPASVFAGESGDAGTSHGYMDVVLHPDFATNGLVYIAYNKPDGEAPRMAVGRGRWTGSRLEDFADVWLAPSGAGGMTRLAFGKEGTLFLTTSGADAQNLGTVGGKVLRINDDGSIPADNPFLRNSAARKDVYSLGHRGALGLAIHPLTGDLWESENGPNGGDEINIIKPGHNYGWPFVSLGRAYPGPWQSGGRPGHEVFEPPVIYWMPAIAVSGLMFYTGDALPKWKGDIFVGALRTGEIPGTGHLERILVNKDMEELRRETLLYDLHQRIRDVKQGPEGYIYMVTEQKDGSVLRIVPAE
ncbi:PQQ-dependent sugar dehydrogenase [Altererythrobacter salegens]|uniref:PQQ-dependent sugar dehydrogenase n=1 Tax=Croceibacterium salegens TaxID=1737568 RepID=A0A6I4SVN1_9SPHN|nr:PQQ-dependent sugar dehydrogenase [Croceibacterium salegens]MXO58362.1 PQQ-dependent sugar dehydrogenase [Croceibacterium salegens]